MSVVYSNFQLTQIQGTSPSSRVFTATVDVTTKKLFRKPITETTVIRKNYGNYWFFVDTGKFTPGYDIENLERAYCAKQNVRDLQYVKL